MIEILPNWHPVFVHFTIALLSMAVVFYLLQAFFPVQHRWQKTLTILAKANLWIGTGFAIATAIFGWLAYNSVAHDTPSHAAMTDHRNWALATLALFIILTIWSVWQRQKKKASIVFVIVIFIAGGLLASTGWRGAESVYRYGLGVMSIPKSTGEGHAHEHPDGQEHDDKKMETKTETKTVTPKNSPQNSDKPKAVEKPKDHHDSTPHAH